ncbi:head-tail connector protein [Gordonia phage Monty]|uniref:Uncharacterized protein n=3 Tax=Montyvirus TaxID=2733196 RepID=A0A160DDS1_9CAUD|nr:head-tail connector protein [Gordonia phage Monty]ANA85882.1 hypothetical protein PBI_MONTY_17 [Gordonia phage Monty]QDF17864.1 hypothetical protein SEA_GORKO_18 [Gordonia phage Gorko]QIQ62723.1 hypothetical protein SEA_BREEZIC_18 [Gordonia phage Breezic]QRI45495.1 hypothetical protein SEA_EKHEIN_18 [Gordonia phage Ekhein]
MAENTDASVKAEADDNKPIGRPDSPNAEEPANEVDAIVYSDEEREDYERFGATPPPEHPNFGATYFDNKSEDKDSDEEEKKEEPKQSTPSSPTAPPAPPAPSAKA